MLLNLPQCTGRPPQQALTRSSVLTLGLRNTGPDQPTCHGFIFFMFGISGQCDIFWNTEVEFGKPRDSSRMLFLEPACLTQPPETLSSSKPRTWQSRQSCVFSHSHLGDLYSCSFHPHLPYGTRLCWKTDAFKLWCWRRLLRVPWTARRSNQSILKEINPEYSLEGLMLKRQYFGHLTRTVASSEKTLMLGKIGGRKRRGRQRMRWLGGIIHSMEMSLNKQGDWRTGKPGALQSTGSQRAEHDSVTEQQLALLSSFQAQRLTIMNVNLKCPSRWRGVETGSQLLPHSARMSLQHTSQLFHNISKALVGTGWAGEQFDLNF